MRDSLKATNNTKPFDSFVPSCNKAPYFCGALLRLKSIVEHIILSMNLLFIIVLLVGIGVLTIVSPDGILPTLIGGSKQGLDFAIKLFAIYAVWLSILRIWKKLNFDTFLSKKIRPVLTKLFPGENDDCYKDLAVNLSANLLGMGSAGTPAGIEAMTKTKQKQNKAMLLVINSTSIQLIPTTIVAIRSTYGAQSDIILPTLLATGITTTIGIILVKIFVK